MGRERFIVSHKPEKRRELSLRQNVPATVSHTMEKSTLSCVGIDRGDYYYEPS